MPGPLEGLRVVELSQYIAAPFAGKLLGDLGASVIKVESRESGDPFRGWQSDRRPYSPQFAAYNRNKRSITIDLKSPRGREIALALASRSDVFIENFRAGVMDRLGLGWPVLHQLEPRLVYCSLSGFGPDGPYVHKPSYDTIVSALSGLYSQLFDPDQPVLVGPAFSDLMAGMFAVQSVLAALHSRERTGQGQEISVSMIEAMLGFLVEPASTFLDAGEVTHRDTRQRRAQAYAFLAKDRLPFVIHLSVPQKFWESLCGAIGRLELTADPRFATREDRYRNYVELSAVLRVEMAKRDRAEWLELLDKVDVPAAPIYRMDEVFDDPQVGHLGVEERIDLGGDELRMLRYPVRLGGTPTRTTLPPPRLGEHTDEILAELGYTPADIAAARAEEAV